MTNIRPGVQLQNMQEPYRRVVEDIVNLSMKVEEDMTEHERMACDAIIAEAYKGIADLEAELADLREELAATKRKFERARQERSHAEIERAALRAENERLRILVKDSVNLLDFLFEPGSYVPAVRLFCEKVKEELK